MGLSNHDFERILICASEAGISDVHFQAGKPVYWRRFGNLSPLREYVPSVEDMWRIFNDISEEEQRERYYDGYDVEFSIDKDSWRYRINAYRQSGRLAMTFHTVARIIPRISDIGQAGMIQRFLSARNGLIIVAGGRSSGRTTTCASFLNELNQHEDLHIVTLESPVEFILPRGRSIVSHREQGVDFKSFSHGIRSAMRQDADVIYVSEFYGAETIKMAIDAAENGHLVVASMRAGSAMAVIERILSEFPPHEKDDIRSRLADCLTGIQVQKLVPATRGGMISCVEFIPATDEVRNNIRAEYDFELLCYNESQKYTSDGFQSMKMGMEILKANKECKCGQDEE